MYMYTYQYIHTRQSTEKQRMKEGGQKRKLKESGQRENFEREKLCVCERESK